jgi:hypothetical protein
MDLHRRRSVLVRMTETGQRSETVRISNDPEYLRQVMARASEVESAFGPRIGRLYRTLGAGTFSNEARVEKQITADLQAIGQQGRAGRIAQHSPDPKLPTDPGTGKPHHAEFTGALGGESRVEE